MLNGFGKIFNKRHFKHITLVWGITVVILILYYFFIEFPMERAFVKGLNYLNQHKPTEASKEFNKVLKVYPKYEPIYLNIAHYSLQNGKQEDYITRYHYARELSLINSGIFSERGLVYAKYKNNLAEGVDFYNEHVLKNYASSLFYTYDDK